jgi:hypothetical protein
LAHSRQDFAHAMQASVQVPLSQHLSHSAAHCSHASAQAAAMAAVRGPPRAQIFEQVEQISAQSMHVAAHGIIPLGLRQSATQVLQAIEQSEQTLAQAVSFLCVPVGWSCFFLSSARAAMLKAPMAAVAVPNVVKRSLRFMTDSLFLDCGMNSSIPNDVVPLL